MSKLDRLKFIHRELLFDNKWILPIFYWGLVIAQVLYCVRFVKEVIHLCANFSTIDETQLMLIVLTLIDITMIANLIKMIITGSYQSFVEKVGEENSQEKVSSGLLKVKMGSSLIGVSSIHLLQVFLDSKNLDNRDIVVKLSIHGMFLISTAVLAWIEYMHVKSEGFNGGKAH